MTMNSDKSREEMIVQACFMINNLKQIVLNNENKELLEILESYKNLNNGLNKAAKIDDSNLFLLKINQIISYTDKIIKLNARNNNKIDKAFEVTNLLKGIRAQLQEIINSDKFMGSPQGVQF